MTEQAGPRTAAERLREYLRDKPPISSPGWVGDAKNAVALLSEALADAAAHERGNRIEQVRRKRETHKHTGSEAALAEAVRLLKERHIRVTGTTMEPDPERPGYARQTAWCQWCVGDEREDPRWPCWTARAFLAAHGAGEER